MGTFVVRFARGLLSGLFFLAYGVSSLVFTLLGVPFWCPARGVRAFVRGSYRFFVFMARVTGLFRVVLSPGDRRTLAACRGRVVVMNHLSLIDFIVLMAQLPDSSCVVKGGVRRNIFLRAVAKSVFLLNDGDTVETLAQATSLLRAGVNIIVFPEGTRMSADSPKRRLHRGAARLALAAGTEILPVRLDLDPPVLAKGQPWWDVGDHTIAYALRVQEPIHSEGACDHVHAQALTRMIAARLFPPETGSPPQLNSRDDSPRNGEM